jgi:hypothetical protein
MSEPLTFAQMLQRWQQRDDEELLTETEWIAGQIVTAVENAARLAMETQCQEDAAP